jgi:hypothetical protein
LLQRFMDSVVSLVGAQCIAQKRLKAHFGCWNVLHEFRLGRTLLTEMLFFGLFVPGSVRRSSISRILSAVVLFHENVGARRSRTGRLETLISQKPCTIRLQQRTRPLRLSCPNSYPSARLLSVWALDGVVWTDLNGLRRVPCEGSHRTYAKSLYSTRLAMPYTTNPRVICNTRVTF